MRHTEIQDLVLQIRRQIALVTALLERFARQGEELDFVRLNLTELRELLGDYIEESGRKDDRIAERLERLERLAILEKTRANPKETLELRGEIAEDLRRDSLRRELIQQTKNLAHSQEKAARYGIDIPTRLVNEIETYIERIEIIRAELGHPKAARPG